MFPDASKIAYMQELAPPARQERLVELLRDAIAVAPGVDGALVIGSLAAGSADAVSDVDLFVCVTADEFTQAWTNRHRLHVTGSIAAWDHLSESEIGAHCWVTPDVVLVEALFATPASGARLAPPWTTLVGSPDLAERFRRRPPIDRSEFDTINAHPVDVAYNNLKTTLRLHAGQL